MLRSISHHAAAYLILVMLLGFLTIFYLLAPQPQEQFIIVVSGAVLYVIWGIVHHAIEKTLKLRITLEYVMIATLAISIAYVLLATR